MGVASSGLASLDVVSGGSTPNKTYVKSIDKNEIFHCSVCAAEYQDPRSQRLPAEGGCFLS